MVYPLSAKFGDHNYYGDQDIMFLVCQVISQDNVIKGSRDYLGTSSSK